MIHFLGDISLNDKYIEYRNKGVDPFVNVVNLLKSADLVVGNLECTLEGANGENELKKPRLKTNTTTLSYLNEINLGLALLANNHIYDNLEDGFIKTINFLKRNEISYIGAGFTTKEAAKPFYYNFENKSLCFLNYVTLDTNPKLPNDSNVKLNYFTEESLIEISDFSKANDVTIVCIHWGGKMEGAMYPDKEQPLISKKIFDAGADIIIGHHSHTLQSYEIIDTKHVYYSLGNFCFSDIYFDGKILELNRNRTSLSMILSIDFSGDQYSVQYHPIINKDGYIELYNSKYKEIPRRINHEKIWIYKYPFWSIYYSYEKLIHPIFEYLFSNNRNPLKQILKLNVKSFLNYLRRFHL